ncbi:hypothetical protein [Marispirochaeta aestuarii]|uniref:hypothetical protein n=1 Tax=Marispirochaeta aestuarii TaxID=1963862 RepID=UPI0029C97A8F|nr:hypothetical protein [Marispirochaeta aestuarii]
MGRRIVTLGLIVVAVCFFSAPLLYSQQNDQEQESVNIDDLFDMDPEEVWDPDENAPKEEEPTGIDLEELTTAPPDIRGVVNAGVGLGIGLIEWPGSNEADGRSPQELTRFSGFYSTTSAITVDARPEPHLRFHGSLETSLDADTLEFKNPYISELFIDYTLNNTFFFRVGKQELTWGQALLLENPADLVYRLDEGVGVRGSAPVGPGTAEAVIYSKAKWISENFDNTDPRAFAYAGQWAMSRGSFFLGFSGHYKMDDDEEGDLATAASLSFGLGPFAVAGDFVQHWKTPEEVEPADCWDALGQIIWQSPNQSWTILGEYWFDSEIIDYSGHYAGLGIKPPKIFGNKWQPGLTWKHAFQDESGEVVLALSGKVAPNLRLTLGVPVIYGAPGSYYREELVEQVEEDEVPLESDDARIPVDNVVSFLLSLSFSYSF